jgi:ribonucleoside-diphosphate reductase alpha chain
MYEDLGLFVKASNLCSEITLFSDEDHTFTCVLSSMNVALYDQWKDTDAVYWSTIFLDCIAQEFIERGRNINGLENAVRFTEKSRALGLGQCGFHTYLQENMIPYEGFQAHMKSNEIASHIHDESLRASQWMATALGEPEWCSGYGVRNTHRTAIAPTKSTALLMGGVSEGINPDPAMSFTQLSATGEIDRVNPALLKLMKKKGVNNRKNIKEVKDAMGSVQNVTWLTDEEKEVFKTAFEISQTAHIRMASTRARWLCQWQSLNLFFSAEEDPEWIAHVHKKAMQDPAIEALYYNYSMSGVVGSKDECSACS